MPANRGGEGANTSSGLRPPSPQRGEGKGGQTTVRVRVIDWEQPANNDFLLVSQFSVTGALYTCRPDLVGFVNGLPLVVVELKKPGVPTRAALFVPSLSVPVWLFLRGEGNVDDERPVIPWTCFSVEPALYLPTFGVRTEVNVFVEDRGARVTGEIQTEFVRLC